jgi:hypothetical protein
MPDFDPDEPFGTPRSCLSCASRPPSGGLCLGLIAGLMKNGKRYFAAE